MQTVWGLVVTVLALVCWGGQALSWFAPSTAMRLGLADNENEVEPSFWADGRGEALWDTITLWSMVMVGVLLVLDNPAWPYFGLAAGGGFLYFSGRGITTRLEMHRRGLRIGSVQTVRVALSALAIWGAMAAVTMAAAVVSLRGTQ